MSLFTFEGLVKIIPIGISIIALVASICLPLFSLRQAELSLKEAQKLNKLSEKNLQEAKNQFLSLNKPFLIANPVPFEEGNYFQIHFLSEKEFLITTLISITNKGQMIADNTHLESSNCLFYINDVLAYKTENKYGKLVERKTGNSENKLTLMDIPPNGTFVKSIIFRIKQDTKIDKDQFIKNIESVKFAQNVFLQYYSQLDSENYLSSNISHEIRYKWYSNLMMKL